MASLLTTMYEFLNFSPTPQPLSPHLTLKQSSSCVTINSYTFLDPEEAAAKSKDEDKDSKSSPKAPTIPTTPTRAQQLLRREDLRYSMSPIPKNKRIDEKRNLSSNARTRGQFKPQRANKGTSSYQLRQFAEATLGSGSLRKAVKLPEGEDLNEWLAVNGKDVFGAESMTRD